MWVDCPTFAGRSAPARAEPATCADRLRTMNRRLRTAALATGLLLLTLMVAACAAGTAASPSPLEPSPAPPASGPPASAPPPAEGGAFVVPKPGQLDVREVPADLLEATVDGRRVVVTVTWTSGVEPCNVLDTVIVHHDGPTYTITLREGRGPGDPICIAIAETHRTQVDLGELESGTYTIADGTAGAPPIEVVVS